jgi:hypothetical protein
MERFKYFFAATTFLFGFQKIFPTFEKSFCDFNSRGRGLRSKLRASNIFLPLQLSFPDFKKSFRGLKNLFVVSTRAAGV